jgi:hypothetical protein
MKVTTQNQILYILSGRKYGDLLSKKQYLENKSLFYI